MSGGVFREHRNPRVILFKRGDYKLKETFLLEKLNKKSRLFEDCWHSSSVKFRPFLFLNFLDGFSIFDPKDCGERKGGGAVNQAVDRLTIDSDIYPLVDALNALEGVRTISSCQGHWQRPLDLACTYVLFSADLSIVSRLHNRLKTLNLYLYWDICGRFSNAGRFEYRLSTHPGEHKIHGIYFWERRQWWRWYRAHLRADLAELVQAIFSLNEPMR